jgi:predicted NBD/HSP70 family sugar kinase
VRIAAKALDEIFRSGPLSRADLRRAIGTSLSTVTSAVQDLVESGFVIESGYAHSTGGRPPGILDLAPGIGGIIATDIGALNVRVAAADCRGVILFTETKKINTPSAKSLRSLIARMHQQALTRLQGPVRAMSVAIAGIVDPHTGSVSRVDNIPDWPDGDDLSWLDRFGTPLLVDNEANLGALGEHQAGAGIGVADMLFVALGAGIGAGLILNNVLYRGSTGAAGEVGFLRRGNGEVSARLEQHAAAGAVVKAYASRTGAQVTTAEEVFRCAAAGDEDAAAAVASMIDELSVGIANAIIVLNPTLVAIGGGLAAAGDTLLAPLRERVAHLVPVMPRIEVGRLGPEAALMGAVQWATEAAQARIMIELCGGIARA